VVVHSVTQSVTVVVVWNAAALVGAGGREGAGASFDCAGATALTGAAGAGAAAGDEAAGAAATGGGTTTFAGAAGALYAGAWEGEIGLFALPETMTSKQVDHWGALLKYQTHTIMWRPGVISFGL
jgi:hypothetical protein